MHLTFTRDSVDAPFSNHNLVASGLFVAMALCGLFAGAYKSVPKGVADDADPSDVISKVNIDLCNEMFIKSFPYIEKELDCHVIWFQYFVTPKAIKVTHIKTLVFVNLGYATDYP